jgi:hypothetical protein
MAHARHRCRKFTSVLKFYIDDDRLQINWLLASVATIVDVLE